MGIADLYGAHGLDLVYARFGDANLDGAVSVEDMVTVRRHLGARSSRAGWRDGDFDYDGRVGPQDLLLLRGNYGVRSPAGARAARTHGRRRAPCRTRRMKPALRFSSMR